MNLAEHLKNKYIQNYAPKMSNDVQQIQTNIVSVIFKFSDVVLLHIVNMANH